MTAPASPHPPTRAVRFVASAAVSQVASYFVVGLVASRVLDYSDLLARPVIRDYYLPYGSVSVLGSGLLQVLRGALFGAVLLPFRRFLASTRLGWLWVWLVFLAVGILGTPAASPGSFEGVLYSRLPLWFHGVGLPEMVLQTLVFSVLVHRSLRAGEHPLPDLFRRPMEALAVACISFLGYTVVSLAFAFAAGVGLVAGSNLRVLGQFAAPLLLTFVAVLVRTERWWLRTHVLLYVASASSLLVYQAWVLGSAGWAYVLLAPILPVLISLAMTRPRSTPGAGRGERAVRPAHPAPPGYGNRPA